MDRRDHFGKAGQLSEREQDPDTHSQETGSHEGEIESIPDIAVFPLEDAKWTPVGGQFIEVG